MTNQAVRDWSQASSKVLGADLVAATVVYLNAKYYGWAFIAFLSGLLYVAMVAAGVTVHWIFAAFGAIPTVRPDSLKEMMGFGVDTHTFWLNMVVIPVGLGLLWLRRHHMKLAEP